MTKLEGDELRRMLRELEGWKHLGDAIHKDFMFPGFKGAIAFVNRIAEIATAAGHHPDLEIHYNRVVVSLSTHDAGGVTQRDITMAADIDHAASPGDD
jgi:4a-hydroxytetrahydrobiopterin dehydratase